MQYAAKTRNLGIVQNQEFGLSIASLIYEFHTYDHL